MNNPMTKSQSKPRHRAVEQANGWYYIQRRGRWGSWETIFEAILEKDVAERLRVYETPKIIYPVQP